MDDKPTQKDVDECSADLAKDGPKQLGDKYDEFVSCSLDADNCGEIAGCLAGTAIGAFGDQLKGFGHGLGKTLKK